MRVDYIAFNEEFINILNTLAAPTKTLVEERERQRGREGYLTALPAYRITLRITPAAVTLGINCKINCLLRRVDISAGRQRGLDSLSRL